ncbi:MAG: hypothetical protein J5584_08675 [Clostridia bacterium]|nr:hypothetical protein [Clostridia bacterium]
MVDPTELQKQELKKKKEEQNKHYGASYLAGLLGGVLGGVPFILIYFAFKVRSWPFMILAGVGVYTLYLYFIDVNERNNKQLIFLGLADVTAVILDLFFFVLIQLSRMGAGITLKNVRDTYFRNQMTVGGVINYTLFWHLLALLFSALGFLAVWLYLRFAVPRWEKKHGKTEAGTTGFSSRKPRGSRKNKVSGMK